MSGTSFTIRRANTTGAPRLGFEQDGTPIIDTAWLGFHDFNLIAYDNAMIGTPLEHSTGTWIEFQKTPTSGSTIVVGSTNWAYFVLEQRN